jgi:hypothetical protein
MPRWRVDIIRKHRIAVSRVGCCCCSQPAGPPMTLGNMRQADRFLNTTLYRKFCFPITAHGI